MLVCKVWANNMLRLSAWVVFDGRDLVDTLKL